MRRPARLTGIAQLCFHHGAMNAGKSTAGLFAIADKLVERKAVCPCGRKATMNLRIDASGCAVSTGRQTEIGGNGRYVAVCRRHFREPLAAAA